MSINTTETMLSEQIKRFLLPNSFNAAVRAGAAVMQIYEHRDDYDLSAYNGNFRSSHAPPAWETNILFSTARSNSMTSTLMRSAIMSIV